MKKILVTGGAGFIGSHLTEKLLLEGYFVVVVDNFDPFYSSQIKQNNINGCINNENFRLVNADITNVENFEKSLEPYSFDIIIHLAAKAGVRPSILDPLSYQNTNVGGTQNLLEFARKMKINKFIFASSSSVYGINPKIPWSESDNVLMPISPYASTKISGELLGHVYSHLYGINFIALRLFTVYGPRQRPDLAIYKFANNIQNGKPILLYGDGSTFRDYTYVDDIVSGIISSISYNNSDFEIFNLGNNSSVKLTDLINTIENVFHQKAVILKKPMQPGDVPGTFADISKAQKLLGYHPDTNLYSGLEKFRDWYQASEI